LNFYSYPRSEEEEQKTKNVWLKGHTGKSLHSCRTTLNTKISFFLHLNPDFGTITILYSQSVAALQILTKENTWKWVKHIDNAIVRFENLLVYVFVSKSDFQVVNAGDAMEFLSGGFYPATIHRFVMPYISSNPK
jgi:isopenicillin N synthase-like dioxygenase